VPVTHLPAGVEAVRRALERAESLQPEIHAFAEITAELAERDAAEADARGGPLNGVPVAVKDVIDVAGVPTRLGTPRAGHRLPSEDADVVAALRAAGAVVVGKTTTHELAIGMITPQARNPHDTNRITGGSSGGSAAAVAAGIVPIALGTDTNGSIRSPAAHCGVVGFKPSRGVLPTAGVAPLAPTQDTVGLIASRMPSLMAAWGVIAEAARESKQAPFGGVGAFEAAAPARMAPRVGLARAATTAASHPVAAAVGQSAIRPAPRRHHVLDAQLTDPHHLGAA
jgi:Asp-tRNA(Asn)/Glu-tRNA(Gln) amidotransferase A subunit family amidase